MNKCLTVATWNQQHIDFNVFHNTIPATELRSSIIPVLCRQQSQTDIITERLLNTRYAINSQRQRYPSTPSFLQPYLSTTKKRTKNERVTQSLDV